MGFLEDAKATLYEMQDNCGVIFDGIFCLKESVLKETLKNIFFETSFGNSDETYSPDEIERYSKIYDAKKNQNKIKEVPDPADLFKDKYLDKYLEDTYYIVRHIQVAGVFINSKLQGSDSSFENPENLLEIRSIQKLMEELKSKDNEELKAIIQDNNFSNLLEALVDNYNSGLNKYYLFEPKSKSPKVAFLLKVGDFTAGDMVFEQNIAAQIAHGFIKIKEKYKHEEVLSAVTENKNVLKCFLEKSSLEERVINLYHISNMSVDGQASESIPGVLPMATRSMINRSFDNSLSCMQTLSEDVERIMQNKSDHPFFKEMRSLMREHDFDIRLARMNEIHDISKKGFYRA